MIGVNNNIVDFACNKVISSPDYLRSTDKHWLAIHVCMEVIKGSISDQLANAKPICMMVQGAGGTGKSQTVIKLVHLFHDTLGPRHKGLVAYVAATNSVALAMRGSTIDSAIFNRRTGNKKKKGAKQQQEPQSHGVVKDAAKKAMRNSVSKDVVMIIVDESSMVGEAFIAGMSEALQELKGQQGRPFGGVNIVLIGDVCQLQPIKDSPLYKSPLLQSPQLQLMSVVMTKQYCQSGLLMHITNDFVEKGHVNLINAKALLERRVFMEPGPITVLTKENNDRATINRVLVEQLLKPQDAEFIYHETGYDDVVDQCEPVQYVWVGMTLISLKTDLKSGNNNNNSGICNGMTCHVTSLNKAAKTFEVECVSDPTHKSTFKLQNLKKDGKKQQQQQQQQQTDQHQAFYFCPTWAISNNKARLKVRLWGMWLCSLGKMGLRQPMICMLP